MVSGGKAEPTPADYLYRMIPVMEALASLEPGDFQQSSASDLDISLE